MIDPTFMIPDSIKQRFVDGLVDFLAERAEQFGSDQAAHNIRKLSSEAKFRASADRAFQAGIERFVDEYQEKDEDLVDAIVHDTVFWQSPEVQQALLEMVQRPGAWMPGESATVTHHFEWVLPQRVNRGRVDKAVSYLLGCIAQELWSLPGASEVRDVYGLQFQKMTAEATRQQVALAQKQLEVTVQLSDGVRQALLQLIAAMEKNLLAAPAVPAMVASPKPYNNLPQPTYVRFIGRDQELEWLRQRLSQADRAWQIAVTGIGGVGKTALALAVADECRRRYHELPAEERFEAIVWVSAKEEVLTAQGRERADLPEAILHTLEDVYTTIARVLEREDITRALPEEQDALVQKALQRQRTLLVMDNMESIQDDRIKAFLRRLPAPTKAIITSREWIDVADIKPLKGLSPEDAEQLIQEEATVRGVTLDARQRTRLYDLTAGLPLPLKLGIARMSAGESFIAVARWLGDATGDLPEYCVKGQVDLVRERNLDAWKVLLACTLFDRDSGASREALGKVTDLSYADRDTALVDLQKLFLVNRMETDRFWVLPIIQRFGRAEVTGTVGEEIVERWLGWLVGLVVDLETAQGEDLEVASSVEAEYQNLKNAIIWCQDHQQWGTALRLCRGSWRYAYDSARLQDSDMILGTWLTAARETKSRDDEGVALLRMGRLSWIRNQREEALDQLARSEKLLDKDHLRSLLALLWSSRSEIYVFSGRLEDGEYWAKKSLLLATELKEPNRSHSAVIRLAEVYSKRGDFVESEKYLKEAESKAAQTGVPRHMAAVMYRRARNLMAQGDYTSAEPLLWRVLEINQASSGRRFVGIDMFLLAQVHASTSRPESARQLAEKARDTLERMGLDHVQQEVEDFIRDLG